MDNNIFNLNIINNYKKVMMEGLKNSFPLLYEEELSKAIDYSINKRLYNGKASLDNNYTKQRLNGTVLDVLKYIESREPIITSSGVLFKKHKEADNPMSKMIMGFIQKRKKLKKEMFKYPKGSADFEKYNLLQLLEKLNANATYGVLGAPTSMLYNIYVAKDITR